jgi:Fis family transcriptional regulator
MSEALKIEPAATHTTTGFQAETRTLRKCVEDAMAVYFAQLDGHPTDDLYKMVMTEVEEPLFRSVMHYTRGNQSKAAELLGINRGTLRKKLKMYGLHE